jgi:SAM domain (Sterile alpha motif)
MQEIADWLTRLGLPEYAGASAENGIDVSVLPHRTDQDLKDTGNLRSLRRWRSRSARIRSADVAMVLGFRVRAALDGDPQPAGPRSAVEPVQRYFPTEE